MESKKTIALKTVREYCSNTTVHGFRYFTEANLSWIERMWWVFSIVILVVLCAFATLNIWTNWQERPVVVNFDDKATPIGAIPFPAVTICSTQVLDKNKLNVQDLLEKIFHFEKSKFDVNITSDELSNVNALMQLCFDFSSAKLSRTSTLSLRSIYESIKNIMPDANITISSAYFDNKRVLFHPIFTANGLCYTFNSLNSRDIYSDEVAAELLTVSRNPSASNWNIENGYAKKLDVNETFPKRVFGTKSHNTLTVQMGILPNDNFPCFDHANTFHFALHSPDELPRMADDFMLVQSKQESRVTVSPVLMKTSDGLRGYSSKARGCYFKSERKLRFFKGYSRNHCGLECLANYTKNACDCMPFFLPRDNETRVCTMFDHDCYKKADDDFAESQAVNRCNCLADCTSVTYNAISSQAGLYDKEISIDHKKVFISGLTVLFKQPIFIALTRSETITTVDFIASFGGLLGLFMGVSILSVIELVYYFTLRLFFKFRREKTRRIVRVAPASRIPRLIPTNITIRISGSQNLARN